MELGGNKLRSIARCIFAVVLQASLAETRRELSTQQRLVGGLQKELEASPAPADFFALRAEVGLGHCRRRGMVRS